MIFNYFCISYQIFFHLVPKKSSESYVCFPKNPTSLLSWQKTILMLIYIFETFSVLFYIWKIKPTFVQNNYPKILFSQFNLTIIINLGKVRLPFRASSPLMSNTKINGLKQWRSQAWLSCYLLSKRCDWLGVRISGWIGWFEVFNWHEKCHGPWQFNTACKRFDSTQNPGRREGCGYQRDPQFRALSVYQGVVYLVIQVVTLEWKSKTHSTIHFIWV